MMPWVDEGIWLVTLVAVPLAAAVLAFVAPAVASGITALAGLWVSVATVVVCRLTLVQGPWGYAIGGWGVPLGIGWQVDGLSALMLFMTALVCLAGSGYGWSYFASAGRSTAFFWPLWLFLWAALNALLLSADLFNIYLTLELTALAAVALIALAGRAEAGRAAMRYLLAALLGSNIYLLGVALLYGRYGILDLVAITPLLGPDVETLLATALITVGLLLKGAMFPLHFWLPAAHGKAPAPVSAVLSGVVVAAFFYLLVRLWFGPFVVLLSPSTALLLGLLGAAAIFWGGFLALRQRRLKMVIAYSTISQLGYGLLIFPLVCVGAAPELAWSGTMLLVFAHGLAKAALFFAAGCIAYHFGHDRVDKLAGTHSTQPWIWLAFALATASLIALPPTGGFAGKWLMLQSAIATGAWGWAVVIVAGSLLTAAYLFRVLGQALRPAAPVPGVQALPKGMLAVTVLLAFSAFFLGLFMVPLLDLLTVGGAFAAACGGIP